MIYNCPRGTVP